MPVIKKKWKESNLEGNALKDGESDRSGYHDEEKGFSSPDDVQVTPKKVVKRTIFPGTAMLKGLDGEVLSEKRKRCTPPSEVKLSEWLDNNLEKRTEETIHLPLLYKYYTELCQTDGSDILDVPEFNRMVKVKFGKTFGVQASSIYKTVIKERKMGEKKKGGGGIKLKEILIEAINHFGNPWNGVRFFNLKQYVGTRCPALQIDSKPKILKRALEMGTRFGYIDLAKGIGMAGSYRLPGAVEPPPKSKVNPKKEEGGADGEAKSDGEEVNSSGEKEGDGGDEKTDGAPVTEEGKEEEEAVTKPKKARKIQAWSYSTISHGAPSRVEDTFPLAITYQSSAKVAGVPRIRRYVLEKYGEEVTDHRWRRTLEGGVDKGFWEHISGSGIMGRIHLLMDDFDPNSDQLEDRICAAIIACHDPKSASANQIKKYISQYHPDFKVDQRPDRFKKALQRAIDKKMIKQLSGLGACGSFQLVVPFTPSPNVLAGDDDSEEEEEQEQEQQAYVPRGTKSRGMPKVKTVEVVSLKASNKKSTARGRDRKKGAYKSSDDEEDSRKSRKKNGSSRGSGRSSGKKQSSKGRRRSLSPLTDEEEEIEYSPKKSSSRGGRKESANNVTPKRNDAKKPNKRASQSVDEDEVESEVEYAPSKNTHRGGGKVASSAKKTASGSPKKKAKLDESDGNDYDEDDMPEYTPQKSRSRGGGSSSSSGAKSKKRKSGSRR